MATGARWLPQLVGWLFMVVTGVLICTWLESDRGEATVHASAAPLVETGESTLPDVVDHSNVRVIGHTRARQAQWPPLNTD